MDPLAQLKDIQLPEPIHQYPIAPGWWILLVATLLLLAWVIKKYLTYRSTRMIKKHLLNKLSQPLDGHTLSQILKFALLHYFPRQQTAALYGQQLQQFLVKQLPEAKQAEFTKHAANSFEQVYQHNIEQHAPVLQKAISYWINHALPPKKTSKKNASLKEQVND